MANNTWVKGKDGDGLKENDNQIQSYSDMNEYRQEHTETNKYSPMDRQKEAGRQAGR